MFTSVTSRPHDSYLSVKWHPWFLATWMILFLRRLAWSNTTQWHVLILPAAPIFWISWCPKNMNHPQMILEGNFYNYYSWRLVTNSIVLLIEYGEKYDVVNSLRLEIMLPSLMFKTVWFGIHGRTHFTSQQKSIFHSRKLFSLLRKKYLYPRYISYKKVEISPNFSCLTIRRFLVQIPGGQGPSC